MVKPALSVPLSTSQADCSSFKIVSSDLIYKDVLSISKYICGGHHHKADVLWCKKATEAICLCKGTVAEERDVVFSTPGTGWHSAWSIIQLHLPFPMCHRLQSVALETCLICCYISTPCFSSPWLNYSYTVWRCTKFPPISLAKERFFSFRNELA